MGGSLKDPEASYPSSGGGGQEPAVAEGVAAGAASPAVADQQVDAAEDDEYLVAATESSPERRRGADEAPPMSEGLDMSNRQYLDDDFSAWFENPGSQLLLKASHSICGRFGLGEDMAMQSALRIYPQWGDPEKRALFKTNRGYLYQTVRNTFLDYRRNPSRVNEHERELPGEDDRGFWKSVAGDDAGWEVRLAVQLLNHQERELVFLHYFLRLSLSETARQMNLERRDAVRLRKNALDSLREILGPEEEG